jgi:hypothetical protein
MITEVFFLVDPDINDVSDLKVNGCAFQEMTNSFGQTGLVMVLEKNADHELCIETALADDGHHYLFVTVNHKKVIKEPTRYIAGAGMQFLNEYDEQLFGLPFQELFTDLFQRELIDYNMELNKTTD